MKSEVDARTCKNTQLPTLHAIKTQSSFKQSKIFSKTSFQKNENLKTFEVFFNKSGEFSTLLCLHFIKSNSKEVGFFEVLVQGHHGTLVDGKLLCLVGTLIKYNTSF